MRIVVSTDGSPACLASLRAWGPPFATAPLCISIWFRRPPIRSGRSLRRRTPNKIETVLLRNLPFLGRQIEEFQFRVVVCTSARVCMEVNRMLRVRPIKTDEPLARLKWTIGIASLARGPVAVVGWNIPLARATGLNGNGQRQLGQLLRTELRDVSEINLR